MMHANYGLNQDGRTATVLITFYQSFVCGHLYLEAVNNK